jgi:uncharacterized lipoprotein YddW (UPF0748 family)
VKNTDRSTEKPTLRKVSGEIFDAGVNKLIEGSRRWGRRAWLGFLVGVALVLTLLQPSYSQILSSPTTPIAGFQNSPNTELRGVWLTNIDSDVLFSTSRLGTALTQLKQLNFNVVYPTVWNWGYTLYPSDVMGRAAQQVMDPEPGLQGRDILQETIAKSRQLGLAVVPWFEFGFMIPADSELARLHPDWLTNRQNGGRIVREGIHDRVWLNPWLPEVQKFIEDLVTEIVTTYDIDGIQFDDHFGLPVELGYDPYSIDLYKKENPGKSPPGNPRDAAWVRWRADKITSFYARLYQKIKSLKPRAIVSLSPNPYQFAYDSYLTDWKTWEEKGWVDELLVQVYRENMNTFLREIDQPEVQAARSRIPVAIGILTGVRDRSYSPRLIQDQVAAARSRNFAGISFFYYETLWNNASEPIDQRVSLFRNLFPNAVDRPRVMR